MAVMISSIVVGSLAGISGQAARSQARDYRHGMVSTRLTFAMKVIQNDLRQAYKVVTPAEGYGTSATTLCGAICDRTDATNMAGTPNLCNNAYAGTGTISAPVLRYFHYCKAMSTQPDGTQVGVLYQYTQNGSCPNPTPCGTAAGSPLIVSYNIDGATFTRPTNEYMRNSLIVDLAGSWYSDSTGSAENITLKSQVTWHGASLAGCVPGTDTNCLNSP